MSLAMWIFFIWERKLDSPRRIQNDDSEHLNTNALGPLRSYYLVNTKNLC